MFRSASRPCVSPGDAGPPVDRSFLIDPQGRRLDYVRLAVTDRCNLRCRYCMPEEGLAPWGSDGGLGFPELLRLCAILCTVGVGRIRITGGEPLLRRGITEFMRDVARLPQKPEILLTTNGTLLADHLDDLAAAGLRRVNLSLDSLDPETWFRITRRRGFAKVRRTLDEVLAAGLGLKINMVVLPGVNDHELADFVALTRERPLTVRFIEAMGFDGSGRPMTTMSGREILARLQESFSLEPVPRRSAAVADEFTIAGYAGHVGIISGHSRTFCHDCSRLRIDARGRLRTCLYGPPVVDLKDMLMGGAADSDILAGVRRALASRQPDGFAAQAGRLDSMANIGG